jgi:hypothetical protein
LRGKNLVFLEALTAGVSTLEAFKQAGYQGGKSAAYNLRFHLAKRLRKILAEGELETLYTTYKALIASKQKDLEEYYTRVRESTEEFLEEVEVGGKNASAPPYPSLHEIQQTTTLMTETHAYKNEFLHHIKISENESNPPSDGPPPQGSV